MEMEGLALFGSLSMECCMLGIGLGRVGCRGKWYLGRRTLCLTMVVVYQGLDLADYVVGFCGFVVFW